MRVLGFFCETQAQLAQILRTILMLRMQEMAFPGFKFQKFSGGGCCCHWCCPPDPPTGLRSDFATVGFYGCIRPCVPSYPIYKPAKQRYKTGSDSIRKNPCPATKEINLIP